MALKLPKQRGHYVVTVNKQINPMILSCVFASLSGGGAELPKHGVIYFL